MQVTDKLSEWVGKAVSYLVLAMMLILIYEVIVRSLFGQPTLWAYELSGMVFGAYCIMLGAYTYRYDSHVRMDVFYGRWKGRKKAVADSIASLLTIGFLIVFLWISIRNAGESWAMLEYSGTAWGPPLFPLKTVICLGVLLLLLQSVSRFVGHVVAAITGKTVPDEKEETE